MKVYAFFLVFLGLFFSASSVKAKTDLLTQKSFSNTENKLNKTTTELSAKPQLLTNKSQTFNNIKSLSQFAKKNSSLKIHNKSLELLSNKNKAPAVLLLKKNFYQNLFPASYFTLYQLKEPLSFSYIFLLIAFIATSLMTACFFILYLKNLDIFYLKNLLSGLFVFLILIVCGFFSIKDRGGLLEENYLKLSPVKNAPNTILQAPLEDLILLKKQGGWLKIKNKNNQTGWISNEQVFQFF